MRDRQAESLLSGQPLFPGLILTLGTMTIAAGMIAVLALLTVITIIDVTAQAFGATVFDGRHRLLMARQHLLSIFGPVGWTVTLEDIG
jgi:hypothetical protein